MSRTILSPRSCAAPPARHSLPRAGWSLVGCSLEDASTRPTSSMRRTRKCTCRPCASGPSICASGASSPGRATTTRALCRAASAYTTWAGAPTRPPSTTTARRRTMTARASSRWRGAPCAPTRTTREWTRARRCTRADGWVRCATAVSPSLSTRPCSTTTPMLMSSRTARSPSRGAPTRPPPTTTRWPTPTRTHGVSRASSAA